MSDNKDNVFDDSGEFIQEPYETDPWACYEDEDSVCQGLSEDDVSDCCECCCCW